MINLIRLHDITRDPDELLKFLHNFELIPKNKTCPKCNSPMEIRKYNPVAEHFIWRCRANYQPRPKASYVQCDTMRSIRDVTFFGKVEGFGGGSNLNMLQMLGFSHMWARGHKLVDITHELEMNYVSCVNWASFCREICLIAFTKHPKKIGGVGKTVEVDESKFGKRKYWKGHHVDGCWVFGGIERESGRVFMEVVEKRDAGTLVTLIKKWIQPGSTIVSDYWRAYGCLGANGYNHLKVNHSINFVDKEDSSINTNRIESTWRHCKESFSSHGRVKHHVPGNLARYMFVKSVRNKNADAGEEFLRMASWVYANNEEGENDEDWMMMIWIFLSDYAVSESSMC